MTTTGAVVPSDVPAVLMNRLPANRLGPRVRELRGELGLSQRAIAARAGINKSYYAAIESEKVQLPDRERLHAIAQALRTDTWDLLQAAGYVEEPDIVTGIEPRLLASARGASVDVQRAAARMIDAVTRTNGNE